MHKVTYKVFSYRGDLSLERGLNTLNEQGYVLVSVTADGGKYTVVTYTYNDVVEETNKEEESSEEQTDEDEDEDEEDEE